MYGAPLLLTTVVCWGPQTAERLGISPVFSAPDAASDCGGGPVWYSGDQPITGGETSSMFKSHGCGELRLAHVRTDVKLAGSICGAISEV